MAEEKSIFNSKFYGGMTRDDKSRIAGVSSNIEELDIFTNADYIQAEQIVSADSMPASTEVYAYASDAAGTVYGYGKETSGSKVRIVSVSDGGSDNPGSFSTLFTSSDSTNIATVVSPIQYFQTSEASALYYVKGTGSTWYLARYDITNATEDRYNGSAWVDTGSLDSDSQLTGLSGSYDRPTMKVIFGDLYICNGKYIAKVDKDGVFTNDAFTLPAEWVSVDIIAVSDVSIVLTRNISRSLNVSKGFWWDLTSAQQFDDSFDVPSGGPQWIANHKETIKLCCAANGTVRFFQMSGAFPGAVPIELPGMVLTNVPMESTTQPISPSKSVAVKDKVLYFGLYKNDKSGLYAIGQLDSDKPWALLLSKRYSTTDYANHKPVASYILGPNFYLAYYDGSTSSNARCETRNVPNRSSAGIYESIYIDDNDPTINKALLETFVTTQPLGSGTDVNFYVSADYGSYSEVFRANGTSFNTTNGVLGVFKPKSFSKNKVYKIKFVLVSNTSTSPKVTGFGLRMVKGNVNAPK